MTSINRQERSKQELLDGIRALEYEIKRLQEAADEYKKTAEKPGEVFYCETSEIAHATHGVAYFNAFLRGEDFDE